MDEGLVDARITKTIGERPNEPNFPFTVRILAADSGKIVRATVMVQVLRGQSSKPVYYVSNTGDTSISGVSGTSSPVDIENPLVGQILPTGHVIDHITLNGQDVSSIFVQSLFERWLIFVFTIS